MTSKLDKTLLYLNVIMYILLLIVSLIVIILPFMLKFTFMKLIWPIKFKRKLKKCGMPKWMRSELISYYKDQLSLISITKLFFNMSTYLKRTRYDMTTQSLFGSEG